ncbi:hypothetical protein [Bifidobacterium sp. SO1]|uniref:hypothetical protein n=1 Tax=Bifidobacterium sp. SO1 TaxID=2809029 RepID=UPI001BDD1B12|nr:hypothetical protein [Bifidobacterium sp. SO1]MBT1162134.1 hypothetical protein [Bifidobacterium sp. SO1]
MTPDEQSSLQEIRRSGMTRLLWTRIIPLTVINTCGIILGVSILTGIHEVDSATDVIMVILAVALILFDLILIRTTYIAWNRTKYAFAIEDQFKANILELADWMSTDPYWSTPEETGAKQQRLQQFITLYRNELISQPPETIEERLNELAERLQELDTSGKYANTMIAFHKLMQTFPKYWYQINVTYRDTMSRLASGEDPKSIVPIVQVDDHHAIRIMNLADLCAGNLA